MRKANIIRAGIIITSVALALLLHFAQCRSSFIMPLPRGDRDTIIINCDTIIYYKKFRPQSKSEINSP